MRRLYQISACLLIGVCAVALFYRHLNGLDFSQELTVPRDFSVYLLAKERSLKNANPYIGTEGSPFKYSPGFLGLLRLLPDGHTEAWLTFKFFCLFLWVLVLATLVPGVRDLPQFFLLVVGIGISWKGLIETLDYGQLEFVALAFAVFAALFLKKLPDVAAFIMMSLAWIKPPWLLLMMPLAVYQLRSGQKPLARLKFVLGSIGSCLVWAVAIPVGFFGWDKTIQYSQGWMEVIRLQEASVYTRDLNQSLFSSSIRWWAADYPVEVVLAFFFLIAGVLWGATLRSTFDRLGKVSSLAWITPWLLLQQILNPVAWRWGSLLVVGMPMVLLNYWTGKRWVEGPFKRTFLWVFLLLLFAIQLNPVAQWLGFNHWSDFHAYGSITLFWLVLLILVI